MGRLDRIRTADAADAERAGQLYARAREIAELARVAMDCSRFGAAFDLARAERQLERIERVARGESAV